MGLPVIISPRISNDSEIIERENIGVVVDFTDSIALPATIRKVEILIKNKIALKNQIRNIAIKYRSFEIAERIYQEIYN